MKSASVALILTAVSATLVFGQTPDSDTSKCYQLVLYKGLPLQVNKYLKSQKKVKKRYGICQISFPGDFNRYLIVSPQGGSKNSRMKMLNKYINDWQEAIIVDCDELKLMKQSKKKKDHSDD